MPGGFGTLSTLILVSFIQVRAKMLRETSQNIVSISDIVKPVSFELLRNALYNFLPMRIYGSILGQVAV